MGGFFLSLGGACSYPPSGRKTPDTARAFFGLCVFCVGREPPRGEDARHQIPPLASGARHKKLAAERVPVSLPLEGPNPQKVLRTFPGTPPGRWRGLPRRKEFRLPVFSPAFFSSSLTPSVAYGDSSLKREPSSVRSSSVGRGFTSRRFAPFPLRRMFAPLPPLCKGRGTACGGGIVGWARPIGKRRFFSFTIPQSAPLTAPFTQGSQTGETTSGKEPFPALQARRWPVTWRAGSRFC